MTIKTRAYMTDREVANYQLKLTGSEPMIVCETDKEVFINTTNQPISKATPNEDTNKEVADFIIKERKAKLANHPLKGKLVDDLCTNLGAYIYFYLDDVLKVRYKGIIGLTPNKLYKLQDLSSLKYTGTITNDLGEKLFIKLKGNSHHLAELTNFILVSNPAVIKSAIAGTHPNLTI